MAADLNKRGINYNLRLVTFGGSAASANTSFGKDAAGLAAAIPAAPDAGTTNDFGDVINAVNGNNYPNDVNKYLMVFTAESINGDGTATSDATLTTYLDTLKSKGITVSVTTDPANFNSSADATEKGWNFLTEKTGGKLYDSTSVNNDLMLNISKDVNSDVNTKIATISGDLNIISSVRKQLNALINIMAREVNYLHQSGRTLTGDPGGLFFEVMESTRPMELGNIKISGDLKDVNKIAASTTNANGDNRIALIIANLRNANLMTGNKKILSLDTYYQNIILDVGNKGYEANNMVQSYQDLVNQADGMRQSVMGVSLDEEMTNMIKYKYAYNANSKVIDVVNQMLETVLFRMGASR
jgi:flagellar hook-associated protein 1 FlgK